MPLVLHNDSLSLNQKMRNLESAIDIEILNGDIEKTYFIAPTGKMVRDIERKIIRRYFELLKKPCPSISINTLSAFISECYRKLKNKPNKRLISEAYREAIFENAIENAQLSFYKKNTANIKSSIKEKIRDVLFGLRKDGLFYEHIKIELEKEKNKDSKEIEFAKLEDFANIYKAYENELSENLLDEPALIKEASDLLDKDILEEILIDFKQVLAFGFSEFRNSETEFLSKLSDSKLPVGIWIDYSFNNGPLFGNFEKAILQLRSNGFKITPIDAKTEPYSKEEILNLPLSEFIKEELFKDIDIYNESENLKSEKFGESIQILKTKSGSEQIKATAKLVKHLLNTGANPKDISILARDCSKYSSEFREVFYLSEIPAYIADRKPLSKSNLANLLFSILKAVSQSYSFRYLQKVLLSPEIVVKDEEGKEIDAKNLFRLAQKFRIKGSWEKKLSDLFKKTSSKIEIMSRDYETTQIDIENEKRELLSIQKALKDFKLLKSALPEINSKISPSELLKYIREKIIIGLKINDSLLNEYNNKKNRKASQIEFENLESSAKALKSLISIIEETISIRIEIFGDEEIKSSEIIESIIRAVSGAKYQIKEKEGFGVLITNIEQIRGVDYPIKIIIGLNEGEFPMQYKVNSLLGKDLTDSEENFIRSERMLFYQAITNYPELLDSGKSKIFLFYSENQENGEFIKSHFIDELLKISTIKENGLIFDLNSKTKNTDWNDTIIDISSLIEERRFREIFNYNSSSIDNIILHKNLNNQKLAALAEDNYERLETAKIEKSENERQKIYSISQLELFAACPYKYFVQKELKIEEDKDIEDEITNLEIGSLMHSIAYRFYSDMQKDAESVKEIIEPTDEISFPTIKLTDFKVQNKNEYSKIILDIANEELDKIKLDHPTFYFEKTKILGSKKKKGFALNWLDNEIKNKESVSQFMPGLLEFEFNTKKNKNLKISEKFDLKGRIDRLDIALDESEFTIIDYKLKSSTKKSKSEIQSGIALQMPIYLLIAERIIKEIYNKKLNSAAGIYYFFNKEEKSFNVFLGRLDSSLNDKLINSRSKQPKNIEEYNLIKNEAIKVSEEIVEKIQNGIFKVESKKCDFCQFSPLCKNESFNDYFMQAVKKKKSKITNK